MLAIAAVLFAIGQAQTVRTATERAAREEAAAALEAKARADDAAEAALAGLDRVRAQAAEQLAACQAATEQAQAAALAARTELAEVRKVIADRDRGLAERAAELVAPPTRRATRLPAKQPAKLLPKDPPVSTR